VAQHTVSEKSWHKAPSKTAHKRKKIGGCNRLGSKEGVNTSKGCFQTSRANGKGGDRDKITKLFKVYTGWSTRKTSAPTGKRHAGK